MKKHLTLLAFAASIFSLSACQTGGHQEKGLTSGQIMNCQRQCTDLGQKFNMEASNASRKCVCEVSGGGSTFNLSDISAGKEY